MLYAKVFRTLWDGTLADSFDAWSLFVFMLAHADIDGVVDMTPQAISRRSNIPPEMVARGLEVLEAPDPHSRSEECEGRRIVRISDQRPWGWRIVNVKEYRGLQDAEAVREQNRVRQANKRERDRDSHGASRTVTDGHGHRDREVDVDGGTASSLRSEAEHRGSGSVDTPSLELDGGPGPACVIKLPTSRAGMDWHVLPAPVAEWRTLFPAVDVEQELRNMRAWLMANPSRRPSTSRGMERFVTRWLNRKQDAGGARGVAPAPRTGARTGADARYSEANALKSGTR